MSFCGEIGGGAVVSEDPKEPASGAGEPKPPKIKAEDNPWYLLATLYGEPEGSIQYLIENELMARNRIAWNRYFAEAIRIKLSVEEQHAADELTPFSPDELHGVAEAFAERCKVSSKKFSLPAATDHINFSNVEFGQRVYFQRYYFSWPTFFDEAIFSGYARFDGAIFSDYTSFRGAKFSRPGDFKRARFSGTANFNGTIFFDWASFEGSTFGGHASFINTEMRTDTSFNGATFKTNPPGFFGAKLHQSTVWRGVTWPPKPKNRNEAGRFIDAYACLKLEMDRLRKHEDELDFFALEMQSRRVELGFWRGLPFAIYKFLSDYGRSYIRPLAALILVMAIGTWLIWYFDHDCPSWEALGLSAANTLSVFGFRKDFNLAIDTPLTGLIVLAAVQTILGTILLFLFGLGIRNKFRMK
jgi:hypothetical protein